MGRRAPWAFRLTQFGHRPVSRRRLAIDLRAEGMTWGHRAMRGAALIRVLLAVVIVAAGVDAAHAQRCSLQDVECRFRRTEGPPPTLPSPDSGKAVGAYIVGAIVTAIIAAVIQRQLSPDQGTSGQSSPPGGQPPSAAPGAAPPAAPPSAPGPSIGPAQRMHRAAGWRDAVRIERDDYGHAGRCGQCHCVATPGNARRKHHASAHRPHAISLAHRGWHSACGHDPHDLRQRAGPSGRARPGEFCVYPRTAGHGPDKRRAICAAEARASRGTSAGDRTRT